MKWTQEFVWEKIESVVPNIRLSGAAMPEALKMAAVDLFLLGEGRHSGSYRAYVIESALKELYSASFMTFGDVDRDWT